MSSRLEDVYRVIRRLRQSMGIKHMSSSLHCIPPQLSNLRGQISTIGNEVVAGCTNFHASLKARRVERSIAISLVVTDPSCNIFQGVGSRNKNGFYSNRSFTSSSITLGDPKVEASQDIAESQFHEVVRKAMAQYMEQTLKIEENLASHISNSCPHYITKLVEKLKVNEEFTSKPNKGLDLLVTEILAQTKFKGVEPYFESIGFTPHEIGKVTMYSRSGLAGVIAKVNLIKSIGIKPEEIPRVITINPRSLSNALKSQEVKVQYLTSLGLTFEDIRKLVVSYPKALSFGLKNGRLPLVDFLRAKGVNDGEIGKVIVRCPQLLTLNVERKLQPAIETLESVGITGSNLARVLVTQPSLLRRRLGRNIEYCRSLGLDAKPGVIGRLLVTCPSFSVDGCKARMNYLESVGLSKNQVVTMIIKNPAWLSFNVETSLTLKINYLVKVMGRSVQELVMATTYLTMSLENRIVPRWTVLSAMEKAGLVTKQYTLSTLVTWSDDYFYKRFVERCPKEIKKLWFASGAAEED